MSHSSLVDFPVFVGAADQGKSILPKMLELLRFDLDCMRYQFKTYDELLASYVGSGFKSVCLRSRCSPVGSCCRDWNEDWITRRDRTFLADSEKLRKLKWELVFTANILSCTFPMELLEVLTSNIIESCRETLAFAVDADLNLPRIHVKMGKRRKVGGLPRLLYT